MPKVPTWRLEWNSNLQLGMYRGQFFTEYRIIRQFFAEYVYRYRVFNKLEKLTVGRNVQSIQIIDIYI